MQHGRNVYRKRPEWEKRCNLFPYCFLEASKSRGIVISECGRIQMTREESTRGRVTCIEVYRKRKRIHL